MFQNIPKDKVLEVVKQGPTYPSKIVKIVGGDTMIVGAVLSTLISTGDVKVSTLKIGGTPLYYVPGQESKLEEFMDHLNEKDHKTANILKEAKVLKDSDQDPLIRVSLRTIKDFAKSFEIENDDKKELFWRYYLVLKDEAILLAKNILKETVVSSPVAIVEAVNPVKIEVSTVIETEQDSKPIHHKKESVEKIVSSDNAPKIDFFEIVKKHILSKNLDIIGKEKIKKSEYDFVLKNHNNNEYIYCKSKDKKSINDGDLASAFVFAQSKKMPCLFITTGHLTKKAEHMMTKEFNGLQLEQI